MCVLSVRKAENSENSTHVGFFDNLDDLDGVLDADLGGIVCFNSIFNRRMREGGREKPSVQHPTLFSCDNESRDENAPVLTDSIGHGATGTLLKSERRK